MSKINILPHSIEAEKAVIASILLNINVFDDVFEIINTSDAFYQPENALCYQAIIELSNEGIALDDITIADRMASHQECKSIGGWMMWIMECVTDIPNFSSLSDYCNIVMDDYRRRELIAFNKSQVSKLYDSLTDLNAVIGEYDAVLSRINDFGNTDTIKQISEPINGVLSDIDKIRSGEIKFGGIASGIYTLDQATKGWKNTDLIILAARPAAGKSSLAMEFVLSAAKSGKAVYFASLEMGAKQLTKRNLANVSGLTLEKIDAGLLNNIEYDNLIRASNELGKLPIYIDDKAGVTIQQIAAKAKRLKRKGKCDMLIIDYLQLVQPTDKNKNREQQVAEVSRTAKLIAKDLDIPVFMLSQMNRGIEQRKGKPQLSDLRESGAIEQDADIVMFIHHDTEIGTNIVIAKNRSGICQDIPVAFIGETQRWLDINEVATQNYKQFIPMQQAMAKFYTFGEQEPF
jgi:replicative DNA helicase